MKVTLLFLVWWQFAAAQWGGELRLSLRSEPRSLDPALADDDASETVRYLTGGVLVRLNRQTQQLEPALAKFWRISDRGRTIRLDLRHDVQFSDGTPFTSDDVVYTFESLFAPDLNSPVADSFRTESGAPRVLADGPYSVIIRSLTPLAGGIRLLDQVSIVSRRSALKEMATLGPFRVAERKPGAYIRLTRNPHYWRLQSGGRLPYLDAVRLDIVQNRDAELLRFRRGELHLLSSVDPEQFQELARDQPNSVKDAGASLESEFLWFNSSAKAPLPAHEKAWFASRNFRLAVSHAIRRQDLCRVVYRGHASPGVGPFPPANFFWFNQKIKPPAWDPGLARKLLEAEGFRQERGTLYDRGGHAVEFSVVTNAGNKPREQMASMIQQDLAEIGIRLRVVTLDFPSLLQRIAKTFDYEASLLSFSNIDLDPDGQMNVWLSSSDQHCWNPRQASPATPWEAEIDRLMRAQASNPDVNARKALFDRVQEIVAEQAPILYLVNRNAMVAVAPSLANVRPVVLNPRVLWNIDEIHFAGAR